MIIPLYYSLKRQCGLSIALVYQDHSLRVRRGDIARTNNYDSLLFLLISQSLMVSGVCLALSVLGNITVRVGIENERISNDAKVSLQQGSQGCNAAHDQVLLT